MEIKSIFFYINLSRAALTRVADEGGEWGGDGSRSASVRVKKGAEGVGACKACGSYFISMLGVWKMKMFAFGHDKQT